MNLLEASRLVPLRVAKWDNYFPVYDQIFQTLSEDSSVVELGVLGGGSLLLWRSVLGERAHIVGVDLNQQAKELESLGFDIVVGDSSEKTTWEAIKSVVGSADLLIDDGGHTFHSQIASVLFGLQIVKPGGWIVVEDVHTSYSRSRQYGIRRLNFVRFALRLVDEVNSRSPVVERKRKATFSRLCERIESVSFIESMVVIRLLPDSVFVPSQETDNGGDSRNAVDLRNSELSIADRVLHRVPLFRAASKRARFSRAAISGRIDSELFDF